MVTAIRQSKKSQKIATSTMKNAVMILTQREMMRSTAVVITMTKLMMEKVATVRREIVQASVAATTNETKGTRTDPITDCQVESTQPNHTDLADMQK